MNNQRPTVHKTEHHTADRATTRPVMSGTLGVVAAGHPLQLVLNVLVFGMNPQQAVEAPRFSTQTLVNSFYPRVYRPGQLNVEHGIPERIRADLRSGSAPPHLRPCLVTASGGAHAIPRPDLEFLPVPWAHVNLVRVRRRGEEAVGDMVSSRRRWGPTTETYRDEGSHLEA